MSPLTLSLPDMNSICPDCLPDSMSSQSWDAMFRVRLGFVAGPGFTVHAPSLMTACQVPPPSPLTSYWMVAFVPAALSARNRLPITSNVSFTVAMMFLLILVVRRASCLELRAPKWPPRPPNVNLRSRHVHSIDLEREQVHAAGHRQDGAGDVAGALGAEEGDRVGDVLGFSL